MDVYIRPTPNTQGRVSYNNGDMAKCNQEIEKKKEDRFALPKASIIQSRSGKLSYGLPDRLCCKPFDKLSYDCIRHIKQNHTKTMMAKKGSTLQVQSSKEDSTILSPTCTCTSDETKVTLNTAPKITHTPVSRKDLRTDTIERGRLRCVRTAYGNRVNDSSKVSEALAWDPYTHHPNTVSTQLCTSDSLRKVPIHRKTWQHDSNAQFVSSQRFAARNAQQLDRSLKLEAAEHTRKLADVHRTLRLLQSITREREKSSIAQNASNEWPHGLPAARRNSAFQKGVTLGGLGYGQGAQSLPQPQYIALKSTMKLP